MKNILTNSNLNSNPKLLELQICLVYEHYIPNNISTIY